MTEDETLSAFTGSTEHGDRSEDGRSVDEPEPDRGTETEAGTGLSTYAWGSYSCRRCDREVERVWRDDGAFVCPDCKSW
ncbi:DUF7573 domain-containing protein [Natronococcus occultus]|uniref:DUF7573 domain-containing protein n=1 Tax=Natronococcus occultus SP4 TaxID=694430 RepID=L0JYY6_9EURY|nr:hypothetical protein [Natronococcus occultus]AGB38257.1 hypothetical protein Natoc_2484 [Natronococcus occultus SP4]